MEDAVGLRTVLPERRSGKQTMAVRIADVMRHRIITGQVPPDVRLQQEELAREFGTSRIPVRDALVRLAAEGLVTLNGRGGAVVTRLSIADLEELYELRESLEPGACRRALTNVGRANVIRMQELLASLETESDPREWIELNHEFHSQVYRQCGRPRTISLIEDLWLATDRYIYLHLTEVGHTEHLQVEHERILDAVERRDSAAVDELTRQHLVTSHKFILSFLMENRKDA